MIIRAPGYVAAMTISRPADPYPDISWWGWGDPAQAQTLPDGVHGLLEQALGVRGPSGRPATIGEIAIPSCRSAAGRRSSADSSRAPRVSLAWSQSTCVG